MKKTAIATALASVLALSAHAAVAQNYSFSGTLDMVSPYGSSYGTDSAVTGTFNFVNGTGTLNGNFGGPVPYTAVVDQMFFSATGSWTGGNGAPSATQAGAATYTWAAGTAGDTDLPAGGVVMGLIFNWDGTPANDIPVLLAWDAQSGAVTPIDLGDGNSIFGNLAGTEMANGPFPGVNAQFAGTLTAVPVPAAVWLMGSGLLGLAGVARRRRSA